VVGLHLRLATIDDLMTIVELATAHDPDEPPVPEMVRFSWESPPAGETIMRMLGHVNGSTLGYFAAGHGPWTENEDRFGGIRAVLPPEQWTEGRFVELVGAAEDWQRAEGTTTGLAHVRQRFGLEVALHEQLGYREVRRLSLSIR
jgi:hypothetical protein